MWSLLHLNAALRALWCHLGFALGAFAACGGDFGGTLGSLLAYEGDFGILWGQFRSTLESLWTSEGDFGQPRGYFGSLWDHFGGTFDI